MRFQVGQDPAKGGLLLRLQLMLPGPPQKIHDEEDDEQPIEADPIGKERNQERQGGKCLGNEDEQGGDRPGLEGNPVLHDQSEPGGLEDALDLRRAASDGDRGLGRALELRHRRLHLVPPIPAAFGRG